MSGAQNWKPHFARVLDGFEEVIICVDNDVDKESGNAGQQLAAKILRDIPSEKRGGCERPGHKCLISLKMSLLQTGAEVRFRTTGVVVSLINTPLSLD